MTALPLTSLATILIVLMTFYFSFNVGKRRGQILAPATTGDPEFEKAFRVHYNTIEHLVLFLPLLWLSTQFWGDQISATIAGVWIVGRLLYASAYQKDPAKRTPGLLISLAALLAVLIGSVIPLVQMVV